MTLVKASSLRHFCRQRRRNLSNSGGQRRHQFARIDPFANRAWRTTRHRSSHDFYIQPSSGLLSNNKQITVAGTLLRSAPQCFRREGSFGEGEWSARQSCSGTTNWSSPIVLQQGLNIIEARAMMPREIHPRLQRYKSISPQSARK